LIVVRTASIEAPIYREPLRDARQKQSHNKAHDHEPDNETQHDFGLTTTTEVTRHSGLRYASHQCPSAERLS
jgi:hypothetical protein